MPARDFLFELDQVRGKLREHLQDFNQHRSGTIYNIDLVGDPKGTTFTATYQGNAVELLEDTCLVFVRQAPLRPGVDFTVSGSTFTLAVAPVLSDETADPSDYDQPWIQQGRLAS